MDWKQFDGQHDYLLTPNEFPISANENHSTYDQFIQLRDTLIFTGKYYNDKASRKLCVGDKGDGSTTNTIEVWLPNMFKQSFQPGGATDPNQVTTGILGNYVTTPTATQVDQSLLTTLGPLVCYINKDGHYRIVHKEEVLLQPGTEKVFCYVDIYRKNGQGVWEIPYKGGVAVFDWQGSFSKSYSGSTSGTDPNGSCSVTVSFKLGDIIQKMTAYGCMERDLKKGDLLVLRMKDGPHDPSTGEPTGNDLTLQNDSNYWSIEYLDLPYNI